MTPAYDPKWVKRAHWNTKKNGQIYNRFLLLFFFCCFLSMENWHEMAPNEDGSLFSPTNLDLADILGRTDLHSENFNFWDFLGFQIPRFPGSWISRFPDFQIQGCQPEIAGARLRGSSATAPDDKVGEVQGTRAIP